MTFLYTDTMFQKIVLVAHRGYSSIAPENTLTAFQEALIRGYKDIEFDVQLTKDNIPVVIHDSSVDRTTNATGEVTDYTYSEIKSLDAGSWFDAKFKNETIPSLEEVLILLKGQARLHIELKKDQPELPRIVAELLEKTGWLEDIKHRTFKTKIIKPRIIVSSDDRSMLLLSMKLLQPPVMHELIVSKFSDESLEWASRNKLFSYHPDGNHVTPQLIKKANDLNVHIGAWWWTETEQNVHSVKGAKYAFVDAPDRHRHPLIIKLLPFKIKKRLV